MTPVSINLYHQKWWLQRKPRHKRRYRIRWTTFTHRIAALLRLRRKKSTQRSQRHCCLDRLSDHELKDIGLTRDQLGYHGLHHSTRSHHDLRYDRIRRLPGE